MPWDPFAVLGLAPGTHTPRVVRQHYRAARQRVLAELAKPVPDAAAWDRLDAVHLAYSALRDTRRQASALQRVRSGVDAVAELRALIDAALEDGVLRYSRREAILAHAATLGINEFEAQLLIAQMQFGALDVVRPTAGRPRTPRNPRVWAQVAATGVLALGLFLYLVHLVGV